MASVFFHAGLVDGRGYVNSLKKYTMDIHMHRSITNYALSVLLEHNKNNKNNGELKLYLNNMKNKIYWNKLFSEQKNSTDQKLYGTIMLLENFINKHESAYAI